jgi:pilus assembly protein CpaB
MAAPKRLPLIIGIVLAVAAVVLINVYISDREQQIQNKVEQAAVEWQKNQAAVLVARRNIPQGSTIDPEVLETKIIPNQYIQPQAVTSLDRISGMVVAVPIAKGEQITLNKLLTTSRARVQSLAMATPVGKRAITISVDNIAALSGMIRAGDYVDVLAVLPIPVQVAGGKEVNQPTTFSLFQNVLVLAVGKQLVSGETGSSRYEKESQSSSPLITLALAPQEANLIIFVQEQGRIRLVLRSPADSQVQPIAPAGWETLFRYIMPQQQPVITGQEEKPTKQVEIYRGLKREVVPLRESE